MPSRDTEGIMHEDQSTPTAFSERSARERVAVLRNRFRMFRKTRPFWGCVVLSLGAYFIISPVLTTFSATVSMGPAAVSGWVIGGIMLTAAVISLVAPSQRHFAALTAMIVSVASLVLTNLGGYVIGMALGIVGSGMVFAWTPETVPYRWLAARRRRRHGRHAAGVPGGVAEGPA